MFRITGILDGKRPVCDFRQAMAEIQAEMPDVCLSLYNTEDIDKDKKILEKSLAELLEADFVLFWFHGSMSYFKSNLKFRTMLEGAKPYFFHSSIESEMEEMTKKCQLPLKTCLTLESYLEAGGEENLQNFLRFLLNVSAGRNFPVQEPKLPRWDGFFGKPSALSDKDYIKQVMAEGKPVIAVLCHLAAIQTGDTDHLLDLMEMIRSQSCIPLVLYSNIVPSSDGKNGGLRQALKNYLMMDGKPVPGALIVTTGHALSVLSAPGIGAEAVEDSVFEILGIPTIHGLHTNFTLEQWQQSLRGMDPMYLGNVYTAEYDGQLLAVPLTCTEQEMTPYGIKDRSRLIPDRAEKIVCLAKNWAMLSRLPNGEKKVAILLHNMPPRADMIGCAYGLDTPESVYNIVTALKEAGYHLDYEFKNGKDIIDRITDSLTNDTRFRSPEELLHRAEAVIGPGDYDKWFRDFPDKVKKELLRDWGRAPGEVMTVGNKILVPCILNGNILIGLQPPRAFEDKAEECYHSTDLVCPWQYLAFYRYVEKIFGANAVIHVGTHGTIEWLSGKEVGLSRECYPDLAIGALPHLYPYIIDVPGEGAQAKRRTAACIIDHLIPSMTEGGAYGDIGVIDDLLGKYYHARQNDQGKTSDLQKEIQILAEKMNLNGDLGLTEDDYGRDFEAAAQKLHLWVSELKSSEIKDGLHIFGKMPEGDRLRNMLRLLVRVKNGSVPSLRQGICQAKMWELDELLDHPGDRDSIGITNAMKLEQADELGRQLFYSWEQKHYALSEIQPVLKDFCQEKGLDLSRTEALSACLRFVSTEVLPRLQETKDEISSILEGLSGHFVKKGPSGAPSRGNARILPTGRNFYLTDPTELPTRASFETGRRLAHQLLMTHRQETGETPEHIAIVVYSGETVKTGGDDVSEILWLYGIRPVWLGDTDKVMGLEVIPLRELGRPRIDVTLRISGLFRDTFPNLIELIDEAVNMAASLEEAPEDNFIKKHIDQDMKELTTKGIPADLAYDQASLRIFGCPPGTYGAGVDILVNSKQWENSDDLGKAYITWSGHGYSRKMHGENVQELFAHRLSSCTVTVKNISSCEADMLDSDDFYNYHGGLISAVKSQRGEAPASYSTSAADTSHVVTKNIHQETARIMRARINNPKWIWGLKQHGFKGAQEFSAMVDILFGWDATAQVVEDYMYDSVYDTYFGDRELQDWIRKENPWALHAMSERMLEAAQRQMWDADEEKLEALREIYLEMEGSLEGDV